MYDDALQRLAATAGNESTLNDETETLAASAYPLLQLGRRAEARKRLDGALDRLRRFHQYPAEQIESGSPADATLRAAAEYEAAGGHLRDAAARYEELLGLIQAARSNPKGRLEDAVELSNLYSAAAHVERRAGRAGEAADLETRRVKLWQSWETRLPGNLFVRRQLDAARGR